MLLALTGRFDDAARDAERLWSDWIAAGKPFAGWMVPPVMAVVLTHGLRGHTPPCGCGTPRQKRPRNASTAR